MTKRNGGGVIRVLLAAASTVRRAGEETGRLGSVFVKHIDRDVCDPLNHLVAISCPRTKRNSSFVEMLSRRAASDATEQFGGRWSVAETSVSPLRYWLDVPVPA